MKKTKQLCSGIRTSGYWEGHRCGAWATHEHQGAWYCKNHLPLSSAKPAERHCYCFNCDKHFHSLGIARHRAMHRDNKEDCRISTRKGTYSYSYAKDTTYEG